MSEFSMREERETIGRLIAISNNTDGCVLEGLEIANRALQRVALLEQQLQELSETAGIVVATALDAKTIHNLSRNESIAYHTKFCKTVVALDKQLKKVIK